MTGRTQALQPHRVPEQLAAGQSTLSIGVVTRQHTWEPPARMRMVVVPPLGDPRKKKWLINICIELHYYEPLVNQLTLLLTILQGFCINKPFLFNASLAFQVPV